MADHFTSAQSRSWLRGCSLRFAEDCIQKSIFWEVPDEVLEGINGKQEVMRFLPVGSSLRRNRHSANGAHLRRPACPSHGKWRPTGCAARTSLMLSITKSFCDRRSRSAYCCRSSALASSAVRMMIGRRADGSCFLDSGDVWRKTANAARQDSIIAGPLLKSTVSKKCRSNHTCVDFKLAGSLSNGGCTSVGSGGFFREDGGGSRLQLFPRKSSDWHHFAVNWGTAGSVVDQYNASDLIRMLVVVPEHKQPGD